MSRDKTDAEATPAAHGEKNGVNGVHHPKRVHGDVASSSTWPAVTRPRPVLAGLDPRPIPPVKAASSAGSTAPAPVAASAPASAPVPTERPRRIARLLVFVLVTLACIAACIVAWFRFVP